LVTAGQHCGTIRSCPGVRRTPPAVTRPIGADPVTSRARHGRQRRYKSGGDAVPIAWPLAAVLLLPPADATRAVAIPHVRGADERMTMMIADAHARSPLVRDLVARLACSDIIVYVEITASPLVPRARTKLVAASAEARFLRIGINAGVPKEELAVLLAHELQHAVEIAERDDVRDEAAVRRLYLTIGRRHGPDAFETEAAREAARVARHELRRRLGG
jgi:hypothetical protein